MKLSELFSGTNCEFNRASSRNWKLLQIAIRGARCATRTTYSNAAHNTKRWTGVKRYRSPTPIWFYSTFLVSHMGLSSFPQYIYAAFLLQNPPPLTNFFFFYHTACCRWAFLTSLTFTEQHARAQTEERKEEKTWVISFTSRFIGCERNASKMGHSSDQPTSYLIKHVGRIKWLQTIYTVCGPQMNSTTQARVFSVSSVFSR